MAAPIGQAPAGAPTDRASLFAGAIAGLSPGQLARLLEIFEGREVLDDAGRKYGVGGIVRQAWQAEDSLEPPEVKAVADLLRAMLDGRLPAVFRAPGCCEWHDNIVLRSFTHPSFYPRNDELLEVIGQMLWAGLPRVRASLKINPTNHQRSVTVSRLMVLKGFLRNYDSEVMGGSQDVDDAVLDYHRLFAPNRPKKLRAEDLKRRVAAGRLQGMIGARAEGPPGKPREARYCPERRPFSAQSGAGSADARAAPPDRELGRLGLHFNGGQVFVELTFRIKVPPDHAAVAPSPAVPTVLDAEGYWLFRPDRETSRKDGMLWNHTRDLATDARGRRELIAAPTQVARLLDLIVWPRSTAADWASTATAALSSDVAR